MRGPFVTDEERTVDRGGAHRSHVQTLQRQDLLRFQAVGSAVVADVRVGQRAGGHRPQVFGHQDVPRRPLPHGLRHAAGIPVQRGQVLIQNGADASHGQLNRSPVGPVHHQGVRLGYEAPLVRRIQSPTAMNDGLDNRTEIAGDRDGVATPFL